MVMEEETLCLQTKIGNPRTGSKFDCTEIFDQVIERRLEKHEKTQSIQYHRICVTTKIN